VKRALVLAAVVLAGCGAGAGPTTTISDGVDVTVTRDFGAKELREVGSHHLTQDETILHLLERKFTVTTRFGGGFVQSLEGLSGGRDAQGRPVDWFYYVNGIESDSGAAKRRVAEGDRIWWDRHDWGATQRIPAVVGSWPEPFVSGSEGKKIPLAIVCAGEQRSCDEVQQRLGDEDVKGISEIGIGAGVGQKLLRIVVGPWSKIRTDPAARQLASGPKVSGVYATPGDRSFQLLDENGKVAETVPGSVGLVAATRFGDQEPTWIVTGTDDTGVAAAAAALRSDILTNRFAVALIDGRGEALPIKQTP
jgi:hypothetical protein